MVTETWPPFRIADEKSRGSFSGIDIDLIRRIEARLGIQIEIQHHPWARSLEMLRNGQVDMITGVAYSEERAEYLAYVPTSYASVQPVFYVRKGNAGQVRTYDDLYGKSIGQSIHSLYFEPYNSDPRLTKVDLSTEPQIIRMLSLGRLDLAIGTDPNIAWDIAQLGLRDSLEHTSYTPPVKTELFIAFSRKSKVLGLVGAFDAAVADMKGDGTIDAIVAGYR
jgi:polar amino acid transport system substrate-binding protein